MLSFVEIFELFTSGFVRSAAKLHRREDPANPRQDQSLRGASMVVRVLLVDADPIRSTEIGVRR
jgi:hypothetical protein